MSGPRSTFSLRIIPSLMVALMIGGFLLCGCEEAPEPGPEPSAEITFICRETGALSHGPRQPTPAINPQTGRATLVQALYCPECQKWHPAPPAEFAERMPRGPVCPIHQTAVFEME